MSNCIISRLLFKIKRLKSKLAISGQDNRSFCGGHEGFYGCQEANIVLKYHINLLEQNVANKK